MNHAKLLTLLLSITTTSFCSYSNKENYIQTQLGTVVDDQTRQAAKPLADLASLTLGKEVILKRSNGTFTYALVHAYALSQITLRVSQTVTKTYVQGCPKYPLEALLTDVTIPLSGFDLCLEETADLQKNGNPVT